MTKVEELREQLEDAVDDAELDAGMEFAIWPIVDSLCSVARSEGVAEGAEQERERIRKTGEICFDNAGKAGYLVAYSVLDPTKERP